MLPLKCIPIFLSSKRHQLTFISLFLFHPYIICRFSRGWVTGAATWAEKPKCPKATSSREELEEVAGDRVYSISISFSLFLFWIISSLQPVKQLDTFLLSHHLAWEHFGFLSHARLCHRDLDGNSFCLLWDHTNPTRVRVVMCTVTCLTVFPMWFCESHLQSRAWETRAGQSPISHV